MPAPDGPQFKYLFNPQYDEHEVTASDNSGQLGYLRWDNSDGEVSSLYVSDKRRREGIGTAMWETAHEEAEKRKVIAPEHSSRRTEAGDSWSKSVGGHVPRLTDDIDGWSNK